MSVFSADRRRELPDEPGVYLFRDERGKVIYVGKAKSIKKRVASHFSNPSTRAGREILEMIDQIEALVVGTDAEALLVEQNFIKQYQPRLNIRLRDDKSYPYIAISLDEEFPRVYFTRERHRRDRAYFGPYSNAKRVRSTLEVLGKVFMFRSCEGPEPGRRSGSPCLDYYIKRCEAPCVGYVDSEQYRRSIDGVIAFLSGRYKEIERSLEHEMKTAAAEQRFEDAARERNRLRAIRSLLERQRGAPPGGGRPAPSSRPSGSPTTAPARSTRSPSRYPTARRTHRYSRSVTACCRTARASTSTTPPTPTSPRSPRRSSCSTTQARCRCRRCWSCSARWDTIPRSPRRSAPVAAGRSRSAPPSAAISAGSSSSPSAMRNSRSTRRSCAPSAAASSASRRWTDSSRCSASTRSRCGSSASTSRP